MDVDNKLVEIISNETKSTINRMGVVTPSIYASVFAKFAYEHEQPLENEEEIAHNLLKTECAMLTNMQDTTVHSATQLTKSTDKAITAIKDKDETTLQEVLEETQKLKIELEKLKEAVYKDELTHTYNRKWLHDTYLDKEGEHFVENGTLAIIDLNYFKIVNDTHGHIIGDKVLIFIANQLKFTKYNIIRYGGDEFIIIFPADINEKKAKQILNQLRESVITKKLKAHDTMFKTSFSIGITQYTEGEALVDVIHKADQNMYDDKLEIKKRIKGIEV